MTTAFFTTLLTGGWTYGADTRTGPLHLVGVQATTISFLGIVACQIGTAIAARTETASLAQIGLTSNRLLLWGIAFEITFTAAVVTLPPLQDIFGTRPPEPWQILALAPFPLIVWGTDELWRYSRRRKARKHQSIPG